MNFEITDIMVQMDTLKERSGDPYLRNTKLFIFVKGEGVFEQLYNRHSRPHKFYKEHILPAAFKQLAERHPELNISTDLKDWGWRQKCGCSCPCSPGFIALNHFGMYNIYVDIELKELEV